MIVNKLIEQEYGEYKEDYMSRIAEEIYNIKIVKGYNIINMQWLYAEGYYHYIITYEYFN